MPQIKRVSLFLLISCMLFVFCGCGTLDEQGDVTNTNIDTETLNNKLNNDENDKQGDEFIQSSDAENSSAETKKESKILIAYFSRADENYGVGYVEKGNTAIIAEMIAEETGGALFHIERADPYPAEYDACTDEAKQEQNDDARPELLEDMDISEYDVIFLGFPIWWSDCPMPVYTFLEGHDFSGKTVIPFCTHAGSGLSDTDKNITDVCEGAEVLEGFSITGVTAQNSQDEAKETVKDWLSGITY